MDNLRHIRVERQGDVFCVRLRNPRLEETEIYQLAEELLELCQIHGCRQMAISLGPEPPDCLYSVFLAKLITVQRVLHEHQGGLVLVEVSPVAHSVFEACLLDRQFTFLPDFAAAAKHFAHAG
jgi:hypothetical protein